MWGVVWGIVGTVLAAAPVCQPSDCLQRLRALGQVELVNARQGDPAGVWSEGPGLSGAELYLFSDRTYVYTRWSDLLPETVYDKGQWAIDEGLLTLMPDPEVTWDREVDRRFFLVRVPRREEAVLFGLDRYLPLLEKILRGAPRAAAEEFLSVSGLEFRGAWPEGSEAQAKTEILKRAWRPDHFAQ